MSKAKRLNEMILTINRMKRFTVRELAQEFNVSPRTILRDLQELSEMGVPLYSEVGPHGGYQVIRERVLPAIAFTEDEAVSIFFALHTLRHYISLPFDIEFESIKKKFYLNLSGAIRDSIDNLKDRFAFISTTQQEKTPFLRQLLEAAIHPQALLITYQTHEKKLERSIQPIGLYAKEGKWYCPAFCFLRNDYRVFRCDRIQSVEPDSHTQPLDLSHINLTNRFALIHQREQDLLDLHIELTAIGVEKHRSVDWPYLQLHTREDNTGFVTGRIPKQDIPFLSNYYITYGEHAHIHRPQELIAHTKETLYKLLDQYS